MRLPLVWNVDPVLVRLGAVHVRYYGLLFGAALVTGFLVWRHRTRRFGESERFAEEFLGWGIAGAVVGGRIGHCLFYEPRVYLADPLRVLYLWEGGVSSHGATVGLVVILWLFARRHRVTFARVSDYLAPALALAVGWIRLGNFFNSELVGRATDVPWAVMFARVDGTPRHPSQLYDMAIGPITYVVLRAAERRDIRPTGSGLIAGLFLATYFLLRIVVESYKDFYVEQVRGMSLLRAIEGLLGVSVHTGQWLSIPPLVAGIALIVRALRKHP